MSGPIITCTPSTGHSWIKQRDTFRTVARSRRKRPWHLVYASGMTWCGQKGPEKTFTMTQDDLLQLRNLCVGCKAQLVAERLAG